MRYFFVKILLFIAMLFFLSACQSTYENTRESIDDAGRPVKVTEKGTEAPFVSKSNNIADSAEVVQISTAEISNNPFPHITLGGFIKIIQTSKPVSKTETTAPQIQYIKKSTALGQFLSLFGLDVGTTAFVYTGVAGESSEDTRKRIEAVKSLTETEKEAKDTVADKARDTPPASK